MKSCETFEDTSGAAPVRGFLHRPATAKANALVLTHGAGSNCQSPLLVALAEAFCHAGWLVLRCDLPFRQARSHGPPPRGGAERDQEGLRSAIDAMRSKTSGRVYLGGHSYGGRQGSILAATEPALVDALLLLSYPLHPPQRPEVMRIEHLPNLRSPAMFVHGTADEFGSIAEMNQALRLIPARTELLTVAGAGHDLITRKNRRELAGAITTAFTSFLAR